MLSIIITWKEGRRKMMNAVKEIAIRYKVPGQRKMRKLSHTEV